MDVFNCAPTTPPDGHLYLDVVFEECGIPGGLQMTLLPMAVVALVVYVVGYPSLLATLLWKSRVAIMEDQLLRAKGLGNSRSTNPNAYDVRKRLHKMYYQFRPATFYWSLVVILRKFFIAFTSLMFNKQPAFQLAVVLLVLFIAYALQVRFTPFMSPSDHNAVIEDMHRRALSSPLAKSYQEKAWMQYERNRTLWRGVRTWTWWLSAGRHRRVDGVW